MVARACRYLFRVFESFRMMKMNDVLLAGGIAEMTAKKKKANQGSSDSNQVVDYLRSLDRKQALSLLVSLILLVASGGLLLYGDLGLQVIYEYVIESKNNQGINWGGDDGEAVSSIWRAYTPERCARDGMAAGLARTSKAPAGNPLAEPPAGPRFDRDAAAHDYQCWLPVARVWLANDTHSCVQTGIACTPEDKPRHGIFGAVTLDNGALGSCAVVGNSARLAGSLLGGEIDAHSTVLRFDDAPMTGHETDVGKRTEVRVVTGVPSGDGIQALQELDGGAVRQGLKFYLEGGFEGLEFRSAGAHLSWSHGMPVFSLWEITNLRRDLTEQLFMKLLEHVTGIKDALSYRPSPQLDAILKLYHSGLCTSIDLYGMDKTGPHATRYWAPPTTAHKGATSKLLPGRKPAPGKPGQGGAGAAGADEAKTIPSLEYWVYEVAMSVGVMCVF
eukprot:jgi/Mesvir1/2398/Mv24184-RA.1